MRWLWLAFYIILTSCVDQRFENIVATIGDRDTITTDEWKEKLKIAETQSTEYEPNSELLNDLIVKRLKQLAMADSRYDTTANFIDDFRRNSRKKLDGAIMDRFVYDRVLTPKVIETYKRSWGTLAAVQILVVNHWTDDKKVGLPIQRARQILDSLRTAVKPPEFSEAVKAHSNYLYEKTRKGNTQIFAYRFEDLPFYAAIDVFNTPVDSISKVQEMGTALALFKVVGFESVSSVQPISMKEARVRLLDRLQFVEPKVLFEVNRSFSDSILSTLAIRFNDANIKYATQRFTEPQNVDEARKSLTAVEQELELCTYTGGKLTFGELLDNFSPQGTWPSLTISSFIERVKSIAIMTALRQEMKKSGFTASPEFEKSLDQVRTSLFESAFDNQVVMESPEQTDVKKYYSTFKTRFQTEGSLVAHELKSSRREELERAEAMLKSGMPVASVVSEINKDKRRNEGGLVLDQNVHHTYTEKSSVANHLRRLKVGDYSSVIPISKGRYVLAILVQQEKPKLQTLEQAFRTVLIDLQLASRELKLRALVAGLKKRWPVVINERNLIP